jgi:uncharacterized protein YndB with AHSA1/START domain
MSSDRSEQITVDVPPATVYRAVSEVRRIARWSPECFAVWIWRRRGNVPARFLGFNRRGLFVWFTSCRVTTAAPGEEFAFDVTTFGMPVARWGYRLAAAPMGTEVTEYWQDRRNRGSRLVGRIFTGRASDNRPELNSAGMRTTLERLKRELETV